LSKARTIGSQPSYAGTRILEAMRSGVRYGEAIFAELCRTLPPDSLAMFTAIRRA
jgi:hypothetical protein